MSVTSSGFGDLQKTLGDAQRALEELNGTIAALQFNPHDQASVAAAIEEMERATDAKSAPYRGNPIIEPLITNSRKAFRDAILKRAAEARG